MDGVDGIYQRMCDDTEIIAKDMGESQVQNVYAGKTILVTGATGYLGKPFIEKLLRCCPELKTIYLLLRAKNGKSVEKRMEEYFENNIFDKLKTVRPDFRSQIVALRGDLQRKGLGLSEEDYTMLTNELDIIYHNGCEVRFNIPLATLLKINVLGTKEMLDLAMKCPKLEAFVYVSSAFSHSYQLDIEEELYPAPGDLKMVQDIIVAHEENKAGLHKNAEKDIIGKWLNSYTFTKALAEDFVRQYALKAPFSVAIFRPSLVNASYRDPLPGWIGNFNGPILFFVVVSKGLFRVGYHKNEPVDYVPVDMCINMGVALIWDIIANKREERKALVFNYGSSVANPTTLANMYYLAEPKYREEPSIQSVWYPEVFITTNLPLAVVANIFWHVLPLMLYSVYVVLWKRNSDSIMKLYNIAQFFFNNARFMLDGYKIHTTNCLEICDRMADADKEIFFCDVRKIDWEEYVGVLWRGLRVYCLKESMNNLEEARKKHRKLYIIHLLFQGAVLAFIFYLLSDYIYSAINFFSSD